MKNLIIVLAIILSVVGLAVGCTNKEEAKILNAFAEQDRGVPEWIEIDWSNEHKNGVNYQITYGLGGRTCHSVVEFNQEGAMEERARKCDY